MLESVLKVQQGSLFVRHNAIMPDRKTLFFIHGLGESGLCFKEVFENDKFNQFNIVVLDLIGYGKSSKSDDYSFDTHINRFWEIIDYFKLNNITVVGHSLGGVLGTILCDSDKNKVIKQFVNIEGNLTQFELFISSQAVKAKEQGNFEYWLEETFMDTLVYKKWGNKFPSCRRYYASLNFCDPNAFLANAEELCYRNTALKEGTHQSEIGKMYANLSVPRMYCYGTESANINTIEFLKQMKLEYMVFDKAFHWLMIDKKEEFYGFLYEFVK